MWKSILFNISISFFAIYLIHYLWNHFQNTWTIKKSKDLVNTHISKYKKIAEDAISNHAKADLKHVENTNLEKELGEYLTSIYGDCDNCDSDIVKPLTPTPMPLFVLPTTPTPVAAGSAFDPIHIELMPLNSAEPMTPYYATDQI